MGRLKIGAVEKAVCGGHKRLKVSVKVSGRFVRIGYVPIVSTPFWCVGFFFFFTT